MVVVASGWSDLYSSIRRRDNGMTLGSPHGFSKHHVLGMFRAALRQTITRCEREWTRRRLPAQPSTWTMRCEARRRQRAVTLGPGSRHSSTLPSSHSNNQPPQLVTKQAMGRQSGQVAQEQVAQARRSHNAAASGRRPAIATACFIYSTGDGEDEYTAAPKTGAGLGSNQCMGMD